MITKEEINRILGSAILAPSGENAQPWHFEVRGNRIEVWNVPDRDQSLYNWEQRASYLANGAAIENIVIAAKEEGTLAAVHFFPEKEKQNLVAVVELTKGEVEKDALFPFMPLRCTNRKAYKKTALSAQQIADLTHSSEKVRDMKILFTQDPEHLKILGRVSSVNENVMFSNAYLHQFFFDHVNWDKKEDDEKKKGFYIDTLELSPPQKVLFKVLSNWPVTRFLNKFGLTDVICKQNAKLYSSSAGFGILTISDYSPLTFARAGTVLQRLWLTATKLKLSLQPVGGVLFFKARINAGSGENFTPAQRELIQSSYVEIVQAFGVKQDEIIGLMFRIGDGGNPSARSVRFALEEVSNIIP